jgi:peptidyl-prolyl cis-trans isomerase SurA
MKKLAIAAVCALLVTVGLHAEILEQILVKVNGEIITKTDLEKLQISAIRDRQTTTPMSNADLGKAIADVTPAVIVDAVDELLLMQRAKTIGLAVTDEQFNGVLDSIKKDNKIETDQAFQAALKESGMTLPQLRKVLEKQILIGQLRQREVASHVEVTEAEEKTYYDAHTSEFASVPSVTLREIQVKVPTDARGVNAAAVDDARQKAEDIRARVAKGEAFEKVATEISDAPSKTNGGLIGPIPKTELAEDLAKVISTMKIGEMTPVISMGGGFEIFKLESTIESTTLTFEQARGRIADRLAGQQQADAMGAYVKKLRGQALIEWKNAEIHKAYDVGVAEQDKEDAKGN